MGRPIEVVDLGYGFQWGAAQVRREGTTDAGTVILRVETNLGWVRLFVQKSGVIYVRTSHDVQARTPPHVYEQEGEDSNDSDDTP